MKYGHVTGTKQEQTGSQDWYCEIAAAHLARIEQEWALKQAIEEYYAQLDEECAADELAEQWAARQAEEPARGGLVARGSKTLGTLIATAVLAVGLLTSSVDAKPRPAPAAAVQEVRIVGTDTREYRVPVQVNDVGPYWGLIDTGATGVVLPYKLYLALWRSGAITAADTLTPTAVVLADGSRHTADRVQITLTLGPYRIHGVSAMIGTQGSDLLIGSNVLQRFQSFGIDHTRRVLRLGVPY